MRLWAIALPLPDICLVFYVADTITCMWPCLCLPQREAREKIKELGKRINDDNLQRLAAAGPARAKAKQPSSRDRAAEYAKTSVPRPETLRQRTTSVKQFSSKGSRNASDVSHTTTSVGRVLFCWDTYKAKQLEAAVSHMHAYVVHTQ